MDMSINSLEIVLVLLEAREHLPSVASTLAHAWDGVQRNPDWRRMHDRKGRTAALELRARRIAEVMIPVVDARLLFASWTGEQTATERIERIEGVCAILDVRGFPEAFMFGEAGAAFNELRRAVYRRCWGDAREPAPAQPTPTYAVGQAPQDYGSQTGEPQ